MKYIFIYIYCDIYIVYPGYSIERLTEIGQTIRYRKQFKQIRTQQVTFKISTVNNNDIDIAHRWRGLINETSDS